MNSTGYVLAAGGIALANEAIFAPLETGKTPLQTINWRIVPATAIMALVLAGVESMNAEFGKGLGMLVLLSVIIIPFGQGPSPLQNISKVVTGK